MFAKIFAVAACAFSAVVQAQTKLQLTQVPANAHVGVAQTIAWAGGDGSAVTLTLRQGPDPNNLATIAIITGDASGNSFTWTPSSDIPPADDYALEISQGEDVTNYSGFFSILGGSASSTTIVAVAGSTTIPITTIIASNTTSTTVSVTAILTGTASSAGTGTALPRNTTFVSQTLSAASTAAASGGVTAGTTPATTSQAGSTASASSSGAVASTGGGAALRSQLEAGVGAFAAFAAVFML